MAKSLICTICSREKRTDFGLLPAAVRYESERIDNVKVIADEEGLPFVILSGEYGILSPDEKIPFYDHLLKQEEVELLTIKVKQQLEIYDIEEIVFYAKPKDENWEPYYSVLEKVTNELGVKLVIELLK